MITDSIRRDFYSCLTREEIDALHTYFEKNNLLRLNIDVAKFVEGKDLEISDKTFFDMCHFNDALNKAVRVYVGKVFVGITEEAYKYYCQAVSKTVCHRTFSFGYYTKGDWKYFIEYTPKTAVDKRLLKGGVSNYVPIIFPKNTSFRISDFNESCIFLEEVEDGQEN